MKIISFDEAHGETWTISRAVALKASPGCPEYNFYGHLRDVLTLDPRQKVVRITQPWDESTLGAVDIVVLAHPTASGSEGIPSGASSEFSETDLDLLAKFVARGGGVLWISEYSADTWGTNISTFFESSGIKCNDDTVRASRNSVDSHLLVQSFVCSDISAHEATSGVQKITYHRGCSIAVSQPAISLIRAPEGETVAAISTRGKGRLAVVGDSDFLSIPFVGAYDNLRLFEELISWLGGAREAEEGAILGPDEGLRLLRQRTYSFADPGFNIDISKVRGDHLIDMSQYHVGADAFRIDPGISPYDRLDGFLDLAELRFQELPRVIRSRVCDFKRNGNEYGALLIRNLPIDDQLCDTPRDSSRPRDKTTFISEAVLSTFGRALGEPFAFIQEKGGEVFQNICPTRKNATMLSSESSTILLDFHTETAFHPCMPDFVMLLCLRPDHDRLAHTEVASTRHIISQLPLRYRAVLFEPLFRTGVDYSFGSPSGLAGNGPVLSVFYGSPYDPFMKYDSDLMMGESVEATNALFQMRAAANAAKNYARLAVGDLLIVDNRRSVHSRSEFTPRWDGRDRWLQRCYVARDLTASEELRMTRNRLIELEFRV